jgi:hypothetical protein
VKRLPRTVRAAALAFPHAVLAAPFAYVPNEGSGSVSVIDTATRSSPGASRSAERRVAARRAALTAA